MPAVLPGSDVAVTGASGFIGSHVVRELLSRGYKVRAVLRDPSNKDKTAHLVAAAAELGKAENLTLCSGDLGKPGSFDGAWPRFAVLLQRGVRRPLEGTAAPLRARTARAAPRRCVRRCSRGGAHGRRGVHQVQQPAPRHRGPLRQRHEERADVGRQGRSQRGRPTATRPTGRAASPPKLQGVPAGRVASLAR